MPRTRKPPVTGDTIGERLRSARLRAGLTMADLAETIKPPNLCAIESGRDLTVSTLLRIAEAIGVDAGELVAGLPPSE